MKRSEFVSRSGNLKKQGFTLVELIIVIAVIGVLAAVLIPTFANVIDKANSKSAYSDAKNTITRCVSEFTDMGYGTPPDMLVFVMKAKAIYVHGYTGEKGGVTQFNTVFTAKGGTLDARADEIITALIDEGFIRTAALDSRRNDMCSTVANKVNTDKLVIKYGIQPENTFDEGTTTAGGAIIGGGIGGNTPVNTPEIEGGGEGGGSTPTTEPTAPIITNATIKYAYNGELVKNDEFKPVDAEASIGEMFVIPDNKIPHSETLIADATNAKAFTHWVGSDGNSYYPGDTVVVCPEILSASGEFTLTAQWDTGYTVLSEVDDFTQPFDNLEGKFIMSSDVAIWYNNSEYMFPIGYDDGMMYWTGTFTGVLDGAGYTFSNLTCSYTGSNCPASLVYQNSGTIRNMQLQINGLYSKGTALAGVASYNNASGVIRNVDVTFGNRSNYYYSSSYGDIYTSNTSTSSSSSAKVGGVCAVNSGLISGCSVDGLKLTNYYSGTGGIVGTNKSGAIIEKCYSNAVNLATKYSYGGEYLGGIAGSNEGTITQCVSKGLILSCAGSPSDIGGLVGMHSGGAIENCFVDWSANTVGKTANGKYFLAGVFVGGCNSATATISNCIGIGNESYTNSSLSTFSLALGYVNSSFAFDNCYMVGGTSLEKGETVITAEEYQAALTSKSLLTGLDSTVWSFSNAGALIPACHA